MIENELFKRSNIAEHVPGPMTELYNQVAVALYITVKRKYNDWKDQFPKFQERRI